MPKSATKPVDVIQHFRLSHHAIAQMFAAGLEKEEIHRRTGFSPRRLALLWADPTFQSLIEHYAKAAMAFRQEQIYDYQETADNNALIAARMIQEKLEDADETGQLPTYTQLLAITNSRDKRHGSAGAAKGVTVNIGIALDAAKQRAKQAEQVTVIEGQLIPQLTGPAPAPKYSDTGLKKINQTVRAPNNHNSEIKKLRI